MIKDLKLIDFQERNNVKPEAWQKSNILWDDLLEIGIDHEKSISDLMDSAEFMVKIIQRIDHVHSVRWRVKEPEHLLEKIVRKRAKGGEDNQKYEKISKDNYFDIVTDLIGVRALHLFKNDSFKIDKNLRATWETTEKPIVYMRAGDPDDFKSKFDQCVFEIKDHPAGYRSIHYVFKTQPLIRQQYAEIQVFELASGRLILKIAVKESHGNASLETTEMKSGIYGYRLLVDGKPIETKKMVVVK